MQIATILPEEPGGTTVPWQSSDFTENMGIAELECWKETLEII